MTPNKSTISEKLTTPMGRGLTSAGLTAGALLAANKALGTRRAAELFSRFGAKPLQIGGKQIAGSAAGSGLLSALFANPERSIYARSVADKIQRGGKFTSSEKKFLGLRDPIGPRTAGKSFSEHYYSPTSMGAFRGVLGGLLGGLSPIAMAEGALTGSAGTVASKEVMTRALRDRLRSGRGLNQSERRLAAMLRARRNA